ncbi:glyoxalase [Paenibacillus herberti]|uniref:Glyoxalase n=1 Tax=Paenibacillus herberti TaxID=1619309 RepID=A0A229NZE9_9BACL|nr:glyoxalase [Paenibacillus herberti]
MRKSEVVPQFSPIQSRIGGCFIPVSDLERSRSWYCLLLGIDEKQCPIYFDHMCVIPMQGADIMLDTMPRWGGEEPGGPPILRTPAFMLLTDDVEESFKHARSIGATLVTEIEQGQWFVLKDPDGNKLMVNRG